MIKNIAEKAGSSLIAGLLVATFFCSTQAHAHIPGFDGLGVVMLPGQEPIIRWFGTAEGCRDTYANLLEQSGIGWSNYWSEKDGAYIFRSVDAICMDVSGKTGV